MNISKFHGGWFFYLFGGELSISEVSWLRGQHDKCNFKRGLTVTLEVKSLWNTGKMAYNFASFIFLWDLNYSTQMFLNASQTKKLKSVKFGKGLIEFLGEWSN